MQNVKETFLVVLFSAIFSLPSVFLFEVLDHALEKGAAEYTKNVAKEAANEAISKVCKK